MEKLLLLNGEGRAAFGGTLKEAHSFRYFFCVILRCVSLCVHTLSSSSSACGNFLSGLDSAYILRKRCMCFFFIVGESASNFLAKGKELIPDCDVELTFTGSGRAIKISSQFLLSSP